MTTVAPMATRVKMTIVAPMATTAPMATAALAGLAAIAISYYYYARRRRHDTPPRLLLLDGGCGLELKKRKAAGANCSYNLTLFSTAALRDTPDAVTLLHRDFIKSGCDVITTASFAVTRFYLSKIGEAHRVKELAARSVELAKRARAAEGADDRVLVAASIPPLGESYHAAPLSPEALREQYVELLEGLDGCDLYLCETMATIEEAVIAAKMCRQVYPRCRLWLAFHPARDDLAVAEAACVSADGASVEAAVEAAVLVGAEACLFNCATPEILHAAIKAATAASDGRVRVGGYGNIWEELRAEDAKKWSIEHQESGVGVGDQKVGSGFQVRADLNDEAYACQACEWQACGASIIGGCCGIGPETMAHVGWKLRGRHRGGH